MPESLFLKDHLTGYEHLLKPDTRYEIGRSPTCLIKILAEHKFEKIKNDKDKLLEAIGNSVSGVQGQIKVNESGLVFYTHTSQNSKTYKVSAKMKQTYGIPNELTQEQGEQSIEQCARFIRRIKDTALECYDETRLFRGDFLILGMGYCFELLEDPKQKEKIETETLFRMQDTAIIRIPRQLRG